MTDPGQVLTATHAQESQHWYAKDGTPAYEIIGKNGNSRPTTLRDARKLGLVPSVTTISREAAKPSLENWKAQQVLLAALTLPRDDGEAEQDYVARIMADSKEQAVKAAERGTLIHAWIQQGFEGKPLPEDGEIYYHVANVELLRHDLGIGFGSTWQCEMTFARDGYGGKVDLRQHKRIIIDIKTKDAPLEGLKTWDDMHMQLAAYRYGLADLGAECGILFVSTKDVAAKLVMIPEEQLQRGWNMFQSLLSYWYAKTGLEIS